MTAASFKLTRQIPLEEDEQTSLAKYLDLLQRQGKLRWFHCPNGGERNLAVASRLKAQGVKRGVPDVLIPTPPPKCPGKVGVAIELKRVEGGTVSVEQAEWLQYLESVGWIVRVCKGWYDAHQFLKSVGF
jgi:hypothetical protein